MSFPEKTKFMTHFPIDRISVGLHQCRPRHSSLDGIYNRLSGEATGMHGAGDAGSGQRVYQPSGVPDQEQIISAQNIKPHKPGDHPANLEFDGILPIPSPKKTLEIYPQLAIIIIPVVSSWWLFVPMALLFVYLAKLPYELIIAGIILDSVYYFGGSFLAEHLLTIFSALLLIIAFFLSKRIHWQKVI